VATGEDYPDALSASSWAGMSMSPILLVGKGSSYAVRPANQNSLYTVNEIIKANANSVYRVNILGKAESVSEQSHDYILMAYSGTSIVSPDRWIESKYVMHGTVSATGGANVYRGPGSAYDIVSTIPQGATIYETGYNTGSGTRMQYFLVHYNGFEGWVRLNDVAFAGGMAKPVIYLYPTQPTEISVQVEFVDGAFTHTDPNYGTGWHVLAQANGQLTNLADGLEYPYLFWEAEANMEYDVSAGFVVAAADTEAFLHQKLTYLGLNTQETTDFMDYWLPRLEQNSYNLITFQGESYQQAAALKVTPQADSTLRVFMAYKPLDQPITIPEQQLQHFERSGFSVIEWGGGEIPFTLE
jgi:uncharacterized protein YraI